MKNFLLSKRLSRFALAQNIVLVGLLAAGCRAQTLQLAPDKADGIYRAGQPIAWNVTVTDAAKFKNARYQIKRDGLTVISEGALDLTQPNLRVEAKPLTRPAALLAEITATGEGDKSVSAQGGAVVEPAQIAPVVTRPADFDAFWSRQIAGLRAVPANVQIEAGESGRAEVDYFKISFDNVDGAKIRAQMARPKVGTKLPGLVVVQWAGVYGLSKDWITGRAAQGFLVINVMPHDLPIDQSASFYQAQSNGPLRDYASIGYINRETSYFRRMFLGNIRATDYLTSRGDWNGKTLVATGGSQGGYQAVVLAGLDPRISGVIAGVPAGCDITARSQGRAGGWPGFWMPEAPATRAAIIETSRYYDAINFASRVRAPTLVGLGLIDTTCPPAGIFAMLNRLQGPKETVVMPLEGHQGRHAAHNARANDWFAAFAADQPAPLQP